MDWYMRLNLMREKKFIIKYKDNFAGIIVDAHVLESFPNATAKFLSSLDKSFIIDPVTYKFSTYNSLELFAGKRWYPKLFGYLLDGIIEIEEHEKQEDEFELEDQPGIRFEPEHISDDITFKKYIKQVINYQRNRIAKLVDDIKIFEELPKVYPSILIPPYSIVMNQSDEWFNINIKCVKEAIKIKQNGEKIYPVIALYKDLIHHSDFVDSLVKRYNIEGVDGYFIWITDFKEEREDENCVLNYLDFFRKLKNNKKNTINFYGGYMSDIASSIGFLNGASSGIGYGEYRNPFTEGGPGPESYYFDLFHTNIPKDEVNTLLTLCSHTKCDCEKCQQHKDLINIGLMDSFDHLLHTKIKEKQFLDKHNLSEIEKNLLSTYNLMEKVDQSHSRISHYRHIYRWLNVLNRLNLKKNN